MYLQKRTEMYFSYMLAKLGLVEIVSVLFIPNFL